MRRRHREPPWGRAAVSVTEIEIFDLDAMELSELDAQGREPADRPWIPTVQELEEELAKARYRSRYGKVLRNTAFSLLVVAAAAVLIAVLLLPVLKIDGTSMTQTLQDGDIVVALSNSSFKTGDVIAFYYNNRILIKRVIASAGDWVDIDGDGNVYVNGESLEEPYIAEKALGKCDIELPCQVPDGKCFVMGDHRATSVDSRSSAVGCISDSGVVGRIVFRIWPLDGLGLIN
ncbi:signal peptidase I [uncultured Acetatifactor sp.]|mgnify:FL=1|jgi:signal peptidase I|uniref:signal peptidase I n=1 Tax=uncultured Acetatifactor sp. TaxID=1671927 RepID=UPI0026228BE0|nr:signal peptidase I [uncultured Acetatifactor sp.]